MKICHLSYSDTGGGAYTAACRLHQGLRGSGVESIMLVGNKQRDDWTVLSSETRLSKAWIKMAPTLDALPMLFYPQRERMIYSSQWLPDRIASKVGQLSPDVVNLHWINAGYLQIETLTKFQKPIIWTLHDMWPFTGGCHYSGECDRYTKSCGACPQLHSSREWDISRWVWWRKARAWKNLNLTLVTPSRWLRDCAHASSVFQNCQIELIPNGIDTQQYKPLDKHLAKHLLGFPSDKLIVLFGAISATSDRRKGFHLLVPALQKLSQKGWQNQVELVVFGASQPEKPSDFGFITHYLGRLADDISLALIYAAADVFVAPSVEDNLPNTVMEALACGTPCVAFKIGGMADMIEHEQNGYLALPFEVEDLAKGIAWVLEDKDRYGKLSDRAREKVKQEFRLEIQASKYLKLYEKILEYAYKLN